MRRRGAIAVTVALMLVVWTVAGAIAEAEAEQGELSVELDIPDYIPDAESLRHPNKFFSGHRVILKGDFGDVGEVSALLVNKATGEQFELEILQADPTRIKAQIPLLTPTGDYELRVLPEDGRELVTSIVVEGLTEEERKTLEQGGGGGVEEQPLSKAILYTSRIDCNECYWESVLTGDPRDSGFLVFQGGIINVDRIPRFSLDGGKNWQPFIRRDGFYCCGDPDALVTQDGKVFISGIKNVMAPEWWSDPTVNELTVGAFMRGNVGSSELLGAYFNPAPERVVQKRGHLLADYPRGVYEDTSRTLYITAQEVFTQDKGYLDKALFVSKDEGESFSVLKLAYSPPYWTPVLSPFVNLNGELRGIVADWGYDPDRDPAPTALLRFDKNARNFRITPGPPIRYPFLSHTTLSSGSERWWTLHTGPIVRIDRFSRHPGRIYMVWADPQSVSFNEENRRFYGYNHDIFLSYSDSDGESWAVPLKVNDDEENAEQAFPSLEVDSDGTVHVTFIDTRNTIGTLEYDVYYAKVMEGKVSRNIKVNQGHIVNPGGREPGDYMDMLAAYPRVVYASYPCPGVDRLGFPSGACFSAIDPNRVHFPGEFIRGDSNRDERVDMSDAITILQFLYSGTSHVDCQDAADANDDGNVDLSDVIFLLRWLFNGGPQPRDPFSERGPDPTDDAFTC